MKLMEQWEKAIEVYEEQLELEYTKAFTFYKIGLCYKAAKKYGSASSFSEIFKRRPAVLSFDDGTERPLFRNGKHERSPTFC